MKRCALIVPFPPSGLQKSKEQRKIILVMYLIVPPLKNPQYPAYIFSRIRVLHFMGEEIAYINFENPRFVYSFKMSGKHWFRMGS